jgi:hypothetical protein
MEVLLVHEAKEIRVTLAGGHFHFKPRGFAAGARCRKEKVIEGEGHR